ncbi:ISL3 family transposase [Streptacidiphilus pinicola]|uniref:ISL3 family transposase n=1 Tax=Streptacidiphilus pinicola TaxID=2219663 RepID=A0A2X0KCT0_9ACTN|nr:ISL3 family transposase [Streptacidiphilus pinicola]RAG85029.1 ISL3 family transposase [Streptacidiphilus pinicola]
MEPGAIEQVLFHGAVVELKQLSICADLVTAEMTARGDPPPCPDCSVRAKRVHSWYWRTLAERPLIGRRLTIRLCVRRFFCDRRQCRRLTFVEQVQGLSERHRRSALGLKLWLQAIATELGGRPGERLCRRINLQASRTQLLGLLLAPEVQQQAPRVLGVDEFAFRRGKTYGTVLVDIEAGRVVDVLPDRTSETFADWLRSHPGVEVVCRDRATAYTKAIKEAAPHATEVADRWHLLQNLAAAVEKTCHQHRSCLRKSIEQHEPPEPPAIDLPPLQLPRTPIVERTRDRYADVHRLLDEKWTISAIARQLGLDRKTIRHFRETSLDELLARACDRSPNGVLDPFKPYLNSRFVAECTTSRQLFTEICARGYHGGYSTLNAYLAKLRTGTAEPVRAEIPSPRRITSWIMRPRETLSERDEERLLDVKIACPDIARVCDLARVFRDLVVNRRGRLLPDWIRQAEQDAPAPMSSFAGFLRQDLDAVTAGLTLEWSSGKVEGHVNRIKTLKRAMYGRATFRLLRTRILTGAQPLAGHGIQPAVTRSGTEKSVRQSGQSARPNT